MIPTMETVPLKDRDVRRAAFGQLLSHAQRCPDTRIVEELGLGHGACRVDIAVINGHIRGLEIKADADSLERLPRQVAAYGEVVGKASLIVTPRHLDVAMTMIPGWWGVIVASRGVQSGICFRRVRQERINCSTDPMMVARLLWRSEVLALLESMGRSPRFRRSPRIILYAELVSAFPQRVLARTVRETLKNRVGWRDLARPL